MKSNLASLAVNCAPGSYHNEALNECKTCRLGTYQDEDGRTECQLCSRGFSTKDFGSKSKDACLRESVSSVQKKV